MWAYETLSVVPNNVKVYLGYGSGITGLYPLGAPRHWLPVRALPLVHVTATQSAICQTVVTMN
jgi:hypothetical protein